MTIRPGRRLEISPFPGASVMAAEMRSHGWDTSPLGPPANWPASLRTACRITVTSRLPMIVWWGPQLRILYNDALLPLLGARHPALGQPGARVWRDSWQVVGPLLHSVLSTGEAAWSDDLRLARQRHGHREETSLTCSCSPLHHDDGSIGGVFTVISDAIQRFVGRRRGVTAPDRDTWVARTGSRATAAPEHADVTTEREAALARLTGRLSQAGSLREAIVAALDELRGLWDQSDQQRSVALALQRSILGPATLPANFAVRYEPAVRPLEVGGDWYDVVDLPGGRIGLVVGDCVGRGLPAAAVMGQLRSACRALLLEAAGPGQTLTALDRFAALIPEALCTTVFCGILDVADGSVRYSSSGHPPPIVVYADGSAALLDQVRSTPLAIPPPNGRSDAVARLPPGSTLLLYTDGLVERRELSIRAGIARATQIVIDGRGLPADRLAERVMTGLAPPGGYSDDVAILLYRRPSAARRHGEG